MNDHNQQTIPSGDTQFVEW